MHQRCTNPNSPDYPRYGGKGIKVCDRWIKSFENFLEDMGVRPEGTSLDRFPDKFGNYEPTNCRWATPSQQQLNKGNSRYVTYKGVTKLAFEWATEMGIPVGILWRRAKLGVTGDALFAPTYSTFAGLPDANGNLPERVVTKSRRVVPSYTAHGKTMTLTEWAAFLGIGRDALDQRINKYKMPLEKALVAARLKRLPAKK